MTLYQIGGRIGTSGRHNQHKKKKNVDIHHGLVHPARSVVIRFWKKDLEADAVLKEESHSRQEMSECPQIL